MDKGQCITDQQEEVRKLQEKVRELEFQLSQQKSLSSRNGFSEPPKDLKSSQEETCEDLVPVYDVDTSSKSWLVRGAGKDDSRSADEVFAGLRRDLVGLEKGLYGAILHAEQDRKKNIDSRTFTRPKKRMGRPSLELFESLACMSKPSDPKLSWAMEASVTALDNMTCSLLESSFTNSLYCADSSLSKDLTPQLSVVNKKQKVAPQTERRRGSLVISDSSIISTELTDHFHNDGLLSQKYDNGNTFGNHTENAISASFKLTNPRDIERQPKEEHTDPQESLVERSPENSSFDIHNATVVRNTKSRFSDHEIRELNRTFTPSPDSTQNCFKKQSHSELGTKQCGNDNLNETFVREEEENVVGCSFLNSTFTVDPNDSNGAPKNMVSLVRPGSTDSGGADDDQLSSTSDSSHTSTARLMNVGDVQHIAHLQEQSLVVSTPLSNKTAKVINGDYGILSPIPFSPVGGTEIQVGEYGSDHSSRSPLSSLHSSPAGSPYGSSTMLTGSSKIHPQETKLAYRPNGVLQRKDTFSAVPSGLTKVRGIRPPAPVSSTAVASRPTVRSGLRQPLIRTKAVPTSSGLPRPAGTGIPRPSSLSRIPPPKVRSSSQPPRKEWTDECY